MEKVYKQPSMKVIQLESTDILAGSDPSIMSLNEEEVDNWSGSEEEKPLGWGSQW